jgi:hypothetical protein
MRRDRTGEPIEEEPEQLPMPHRCEDGWVGEDDLGRLIPCPTCKADLIRRLRAQREAAR